MMGTRRIVRAILALFCCTAIALSVAKLRPANAADAKTLEKSTAKPGYAVGRIYGEDGKPIAIEDVEYHILMTGVSTKGGEKIGSGPQPNADGRYEQKLVDGIYEVSAFIMVPWDGKAFRYDLAPLQRKGNQESAKGVVADFQWRLSGAISQLYKDPKTSSHWYGAAVTVKPEYAPGNPPKGTVYHLTVTPAGKLIDGSEGKPLKFERNYNDLYGEIDDLNDIPVGKWKLSGTMKPPGGADKPLVFDNTPSTGFVEAIELVFAPYPNDGRATGKNIIHCKSK